MRVACVRACVRVCVCVCVCVCVLGVEGSWVFASTALLVVWTDMYLTGYSDYLIGFREPLSGECIGVRFEKTSCAVNRPLKCNY